VAMDEEEEESRTRRLPSASSCMSDQWAEEELASHVWFWGRGSALVDGDEADMFMCDV
jgi:hypothetical protein